MNGDFSNVSANLGPGFPCKRFSSKCIPGLKQGTREVDKKYSRSAIIYYLVLCAFALRRLIKSFLARFSYMCLNCRKRKANRVSIPTYLQNSNIHQRHYQTTIYNTLFCRRNLLKLLPSVFFFLAFGIDSHRRHQHFSTKTWGGIANM